MSALYHVSTCCCSLVPILAVWGGLFQGSSQYPSSQSQTGVFYAVSGLSPSKEIFLMLVSMQFWAVSIKQHCLPPPITNDSKCSPINRSVPSLPHWEVLEQWTNSKISHLSTKGTFSVWLLEVLKIYGSTSTSPENISTSTAWQCTEQKTEMSVTLCQVPKEWGWRGFPDRTFPALHTRDHGHPHFTAHSPGNSSFIILFVCCQREEHWEEQEEKHPDYTSTLSACFSALLEFDIFR